MSQTRTRAASAASYLVLLTPRAKTSAPPLHSAARFKQHPPGNKLAGSSAAENPAKVACTGMRAESPKQSGICYRNTVLPKKRPKTVTIKSGILWLPQSGSSRPSPHARFPSRARACTAWKHHRWAKFCTVARFPTLFHAILMQEIASCSGLSFASVKVG